MIHVDHALQALVCTVCQEAVELSRRKIGDPETLLLLREEMARTHKSCRAFPNDPERAKREREFSERVDRELRRAGIGR